MVTYCLYARQLLLHYPNYGHPWPSHILRATRPAQKAPRTEKKLNTFFVLVIQWGYER